MYAIRSYYALPSDVVLLVGGAGSAAYAKALRDVKAVVVSDLASLRPVVLGQGQKTRSVQQDAGRFEQVPGAGGVQRFHDGGVKCLVQVIVKRGVEAGAAESYNFV